MSRHFDVLFIGDMYYDDVIGQQVTRLVRRFVTGSNPGDKIALVGDPGAISHLLFIYTKGFGSLYVFLFLLKRKDYVVVVTNSFTPLPLT